MMLCIYKKCRPATIWPMQLQYKRRYRKTFTIKAIILSWCAGYPFPWYKNNKDAVDFLTNDVNLRSSHDSVSEIDGCHRKEIMISVKNSVGLNKVHYNSHKKCSVTLFITLLTLSFPFGQFNG